MGEQALVDVFSGEVGLIGFLENLEDAHPGMRDFQARLAELFGFLVHGKTPRGAIRRLVYHHRLHDPDVTTHA